jgi:hypothetical protein
MRYFDKDPSVVADTPHNEVGPFLGLSVPNARLKLDPQACAMAGLGSLHDFEKGAELSGKPGVIGDSLVARA